MPSVVPCKRGPAAPGGRQACRKNGSTEAVLGLCAVQASSVTGTGSLWNFGWRMGEENGACQCLCSPAKLCPSGAQHLSLLGFSRPPHSPSAEPWTFNIPDVKSRWLSELTESGPSAFRLGGSALPGGPPFRRPGSLPPVPVARTASPPFLPLPGASRLHLAPESPLC